MYLLQQRSRQRDLREEACKKREERKKWRELGGAMRTAVTFFPPFSNYFFLSFPLFSWPPSSLEHRISRWWLDPHHKNAQLRKGRSLYNGFMERGNLGKVWKREKVPNERSGLNAGILNPVCGVPPPPETAYCYNHSKVGNRWSRRRKGLPRALRKGLSLSLFAAVRQREREIEESFLGKGGGEAKNYRRGGRRTLRKCSSPLYP